MNERVKDKIKELEKYTDELSQIIPKNLNIYEKDFKTKAACERYIEIITEALVDLAMLLIKDRGLQLPEIDLGAFDVLSQDTIISSEFAEKLKDARRMRNIIAHEYGKVDDEIVFDAIKNELIGDVRIFIKTAKKQ